MDVVLRTNSDDPAFALSSIKRFGGDSGFEAIISVVSTGFSASHRFYFGVRELRECLESLRLMESTLSGSAALFQEHEVDEVTFSMRTGGHVTVQGDLRDFGMFEQSFTFGFVTDQTVLAPLIRDLEVVLSMPDTPVDEL